MAIPHKPRPSTFTVSQIQLSNGRRQIIYHIRGTAGLVPEAFFSPDVSGRYFLVSAGPSGHPVVGWIGHGRLIRLKPFHTWVSYEAW